jgi:hypothetical protein
MTTALRVIKGIWRMINKTKLVIIIVLGIFIIIIFRHNSIISRSSAIDTVPPQQPVQIDYASDAKWACREFVADNLKAPSTAEFPNYNNFTAEKVNNKETETKGYIVYSVYGEVDSQNSFGAMLRSRFMCEVIKNSSADTWNLVRIQFYN